MLGQLGEDPTLASDLIKEIQSFGRIPRRSKNAKPHEVALADKLRNFKQRYRFSQDQEKELQRLEDQGGEKGSMSRSRGCIQDPIGVPMGPWVLPRLRDIDTLSPP